MASSILRTIAPPEPTPSRENQEGRLQVDGHFFMRDGQRTGLRGVTYGPFSPDRHGHPFPDRRVVREDFAHMTRAGFNAVRVYHVPPPWFLDGQVLE